MENEIKVYAGDKKILKEFFKTSFYTVRMALSGKTNTPIRREIRAHALSIGGKIVDPDENLEECKPQTPNQLH